MILLQSALSAGVIVGGIAAAAFYIRRRADLREAAAEFAYPPEGQFLTVNGRLLHYVQRGTGPDLVIVHGGGGSTRDYSFRFLDHLTDRYRVTVFDRPGHGYSQTVRPEYDAAWLNRGDTLNEQADALAEAMRQLGVTRPLVMGQSYGGAVALAWALRHPVAGVVTVAGVSHPWPGGKLGPVYRINGSALGGYLMAPIFTAFPPKWRVDHSLRRIFEPDAAPEGYVDYYGIPMVLRRSAIRANARQINTVYGQVVAQEKLYGRLDVPLEIVHGDRDTVVPAEIHALPLRDAVAGAHLDLLKGIGHMPHHTAPAAVVAAIDRAAARAGLR